MKDSHGAVLRASHRLAVGKRSSFTGNLGFESRKKLMVVTGREINLNLPLSDQSH